jgi:S1-C subfamily serine protease
MATFSAFLKFKPKPLMIRKFLFLVVAIWSIVVPGCANVAAAEPSPVDEIFSEPNAAITSQDTAVGILYEANGTRHFGSGTIIGGGLVLTAAHVVSGLPNEAPVQILRGAQHLSGHVIARGIEPQNDVALVQLTLNNDLESEQIRQVRAPELCKSPLQPGQRVVVLFGQGLVRTVGSADFQFLEFGRNSYSSNAITAFLEPGSSGAAVFDKTSGCLIGIVQAQHKKRIDIGSIEGGFVAHFYVSHLTGLETLRTFLHENNVRLANIQE